MAQALRHRRQNPNSNIKRQSPRHVCRPPSGKQLEITSNVIWESLSIQSGLPTL
jgi:hypothetical protein